jgi:DNA mismatch repair protein MLH1
MVLVHIRVVNASHEFFYQLGLSEFSNFGTIELSEGLSLHELLRLSLDAEEPDGMVDQAQADEIEVRSCNVGLTC